MKRKLLLLICIFASSILMGQNLKPKKDKATKKCGYQNSAKEWVVQPVYDDADKIKNGFGKIYLNDKQGLVNEQGAVVLEPQFDDISKIKNGFAEVELDNKLGLINEQAVVVFKPQFDDIEKFKSGFAQVVTGNKIGVINKQGELVFEPQFDELESFSNGLAQMKKGNRWGLVNSKGEIIFDARFSQKLKFEDSKSIAMENGKYGIVHLDGRVLFDFLADKIAIEDALYFIQKNRKWKIYNADFKAISPEYDDIKTTFKGTKYAYFVDGRCLVRLNGKYGFINKKAEMVIPNKFDQIAMDGFRGGFCAAKSGDKWGYIKKDGTYLVEPQFDEAESFVNLGTVNVAKAKIGQKEYEVSFTGTVKLIRDPEAEAAAAQAAADKKAAADAQALANAQALGVNTNPTPDKTQTNTQKSTSPAEAAAPDHSWLIGTWIVETEKMAGETQKGKMCNYAHWVFTDNNSGYYASRQMLGYDKLEPAKHFSYTIDGNRIITKSIKYTFKMSDDKRSMTLHGPLGVVWTLKKK